MGRTEVELAVCALVGLAARPCAPELEPELVALRPERAGGERDAVGDEHVARVEDALAVLSPKPREHRANVSTAP